MARRPRSVRLSLGSFAGGLVTNLAANLVGLDQAVEATNVDTSQGRLAGLYGPGTSVSSVSVDQKHVHYSDNLGWFTEATAQHHAYDTIAGNTGYRYSFYTDGGVAKYANGSVSGKWLGVAAPAAAPGSVSNGASGGVVYYRCTYMTDPAGTRAPIESNPSDALTSITNGTGATISLVASADSNVGKIRVYATVPNGTPGAYYLVGTYSNSNQNVTPPDAVASSSAILSWELNGRDSNATYIDDHSPAPTPNVMANALHTAYSPGTAVLPATGILFLGVGSTLQWSETGYPWYFPITNGWLADGTIQAIVTDQAITYVLTRNYIFVVTGTDDEDLNITRSRSPFGTTYGQSAVMTPYGLMFQAEGGIALFDGNSSRVITAGILNPADITKNYEATWWDQQLILVCQDDRTGGYILDFTRGLDGLQVMTHNVPATAITRADAAATPGPYVATSYSTNGYVKPWRPSQRANVGGASPLAWSWKTGRIDAGKFAGVTPGTPFYASRIFPVTEGDTSIVVNAYRYPSTLVGTVTVTGDSWLPGSWGEIDYLQMTFSSAGGAGILRAVEIDCEVAA